MPDHRFPYKSESESEYLLSQYKFTRKFFLRCTVADKINNNILTRLQRLKNTRNTAVFYKPTVCYKPEVLVYGQLLCRRTRLESASDETTNRGPLCVYSCKENFTLCVHLSCLPEDPRARKQTEQKPANFVINSGKV